MKFLLPNYSCLQNPWLGGLPPPDPHSLCPLSSTEFVEPPLPEQNSWVRHWFEETRPLFVSCSCIQIGHSHVKWLNLWKKFVHEIDWLLLEKDTCWQRSFCDLLRSAEMGVFWWCEASWKGEEKNVNLRLYKDLWYWFTCGWAAVAKLWAGYPGGGAQRYSKLLYNVPKP